MPLTAKGRKILRRMQEEYGPEKGSAVFYASRNKGLITDVDLPRKPRVAKRARRKPQG